MKLNFREKDSAILKIVNRVKFHGNDSFFIVQDIFGDKHLLNASYYSAYDFEIGQEIICRVDKINCKGKVFFEPSHPIYIEGSDYDFRKDVQNGKVTFFDIFNNPTILLDAPQKETTRFRVVKIKKGICYLTQSVYCEPA
jgi:hypothetical protein